MNTEVRRELKRIVKMTRTLANMPKLQTVTVQIVDVGNGYGREVLCPTVLVVFKTKSVSFMVFAFSILLLFLSILKKKNEKLLI